MRACSSLSLVALLAAACTAPSSTADDSEVDTDSGIDSDVDTDSGDTDTGEPVLLSGTLSCFEGCSGPLGVAVFHPGEMHPSRVAIFPGPGPYELDLPPHVGPIEVFAFEDLDGNQAYDATEYAGGHDADLIVTDVDLTGVDIHIDRPAEELELPGVLDELGTPIEPGELIVYLDGSVDGAEVAAAAGGTVHTEIDSLDAIVLVFEAETLGELQAMEDVVRGIGGVLGTERSTWIFATETRGTDDNASVSGADRWAYDHLRAAEAKDMYDECSYHFTDAAQFARQVDVAIVDNDLLGARDGSEFAGLTKTFTDHYVTRDTDGATTGDHGSRVASILAAVNDGTGMNGLLAGFSGTTPAGATYSVTYGLDLHNVGHGRSIRTAPLLAGLDAAARGRARVVNMSIGHYAKSLGALRAMRSARARIATILDANPSVVFVFSAGNDNRDLGTGFHQSSLDRTNLLVVAATDRNDARASFSNWGSYVDIAAPGDDLYTFGHRVVHTSGGSALSTSSYTTVDGTSGSAPIVTAHVAMLLAFEPSISPSSVAAALARAADPVAATLGGKRAHFRRTVQAELEGEINTGTEWLLDFDAIPSSISGDEACFTSAGRSSGHSCVPLLGVSSLSSVSGSKDWHGEPYDLAGSLVGSGLGDGVELRITGTGITFGVGPLDTTYTGTVGVGWDPDPVPGDLYVSGTFSGSTTGGISCSYSGAWEGTLRRATP